MNLGFRKVFAVVAGLFLAINVPAQDIPLLPADPAVLKGVMPNGMAYYLVANPDEKGIADFALVQKTGLKTTDDGEKALTVAGDALKSLKRLNVKKYIADHELMPDDNGLVELTDDATIFRFNNVRFSEGVNVMDSTLLMIMDIADRANYIDDEFIGKWYVPADQAIIVSGDIDSKAVASKLLYMSYMIPSAESEKRPEYVRQAEKHQIVVSEKNGLSEVSCTWTSERSPREYMNTIQPEILEMSFNTLGSASVYRIKKYLMEMGVPVADVSYSHVCSSEYPYDDSFTVHVAVAKENAGKAEEAIAYAMSSIDEKGLMANEYMMAESSYLLQLGKDVNKTFRSNHEYIDRCKNAFLYNSSLASSKEKLAFHTSRNLPDTMRQRLFNGIASAFIDVEGLPVPANQKPYQDIAVADTLTASVPQLKVKVKSSKKEPVSGGTIWTFANGIQVVYKKMATDRMYYALALNGGYGNVEGLQPGEGAFIADHFKSYRISGMNSGDFMRFLGKEDITMDVDVNLSNTMISGNLPKNKVSMLMRALLALANEKTVGGKKDFEYHRNSEYLALDYAQGSLRSRMTAIDSIMCPGYSYSPYKVKGRLTDGFPKRAERFIGSQFGKVNDGVLVLVGNMDEEDLKKILVEYVGHFRTAEGLSRKPVIRYQPISGCSTYTVEGESDNVDMILSARMPLTMDNYLASGLALMIMNREIAQKLNGTGCGFSLTHTNRIYPEERINVVISIPSASLNYLDDVRSVLSGLKSMKLTDSELKPYKDALKGHMDKEMTSPEYWVHAIALRYLDGKDLSTKYADRINALTVDRVKAILTLLDEGCRVEYVTIKK